MHGKSSQKRSQHAYLIKTIKEDALSRAENSTNILHAMPGDKALMVHVLADVDGCTFPI